MEITRNMDRMAHTAREMAEAQQNSYEAAVDNLAAFQRRNVKLAENGLEFLRLQESNARAAQEWWASSVKLLQLQQRNVRFAQDWLTGGAQFLQEQLDHNRRTAETFAQTTRAQQEGFRALAQEWTRTYQSFFSPFTYARYAREGLRTAQQATQQGLEATQQVTRQGLRLAQEATEQTEQAIQQTERANRQAELEATIADIFKVKNYNDLTVEQVSKKLSGLSADELKKVREYEKQNKNRETLIEQIDRRLKDVS